MAPGVAFALSLILVVGHLQEGPGSLAKTFTFPEYPYKETTKNVSRPSPSNSFLRVVPRVERPIQVMAEATLNRVRAETFTTPGVRCAAVIRLLTLLLPWSRPAGRLIGASPGYHVRVNVDHQGSAFSRGCPASRVESMIRSEVIGVRSKYIYIYMYIKREIHVRSRRGLGGSELRDGGERKRGRDRFGTSFEENIRLKVKVSASWRARVFALRSSSASSKPRRKNPHRRGRDLTGAGR